MTTRTVFIGVAALVLLAASANAQGKVLKPVVVSQVVLKAMIANKPKSKTPLGARVGIGRKSSVVDVKPVQAAPTSVRDISPISRKK